MLNTQKLLYVLPDLAYVAELLPDKKPHTFAIQSFKQVNGEFLNETEFIAENIVKLVTKLEEGEEYFLILPDFLFTNTIVSVKEISETKIKEQLNAETLPKLGLKDDSHLTETIILNQLKGTTRVQLSAIEKSVLSVFKVALAEKDIKIAGVAPLSWAIKSLISLEPSISVLQLGTKLYTAQHYIGVDQTTTAEVSSPENIVETIKTLKGAEPSIQTVYLCSNSIIEDKLKEELSKILPIQQMALKDSNEKIPSYVSQVITSTMRTLSIPDFSVPTFKLGKPTEEEKNQYASLLTASSTAIDEDEEDSVSSDLPKPNISPIEEATLDEKEPEATDTAQAEEKPQDIETLKEEVVATEKLPEIEDSATDSTHDQTTEEIDEEETEEQKADLSDKAVVTPSLAAAAPVVVGAATEVAGQTASLASAAVVSPSLTSPGTAGQDSDTKNHTEKLPESAAAETAAIKEEPSSETKTATTSFSPTSEPVIVVGDTPSDTSATDTASISPVANSAVQEIDLKQFTQNGETAVASTEKPVIKNKSGAQHMMKMILITTGVFIVTVAIGIGVGLAILKYSGSQQKTGSTPVVEVEQASPTPIATATPTPTPAASESATLDKSEVKILIVNATKKAGYAGQIKTKLTAEKFTDITAGNAKSEYEKTGNFVYLKEDNKALVEALNKATDLEFTTSDDPKAEDPKGTYDAVIVLNE